ncbi:gustatory receptor for sugar taste 64a-like isoform X2 [Eurosta solidaginis]|uniref:gustatory receptor for sugar taste 64a-like isoform X2 n=1 Tax=Eurosta solidaginis TaxID=178769 RepID=UPI0035306E8D
MLNRNKLREILMKYQMGMPRNDVGQTVGKFDKDRDPKASTILKSPNEKLVVENIEDTNNVVKAVELIGRRTPIEYFTYNEEDFKYIKPKEHTDYSKLDIFHRAISPILIVGQCFSLLPVLGVGHPNPRHLHFSFKSIPVLITLIFLIASSSLNLATMKYLAKIGVNAKNLVGVVFFTCVQSSTILFFALAPRWPRLIRYWTRTEMIFVRKPYEMPKRHLSSRVRRAAFAIIILSATEHMLYLISAVISQYRKASFCASVNNETYHFTFNDFTYKNYDYVFEVYPNTKFVGGLILVINFFCTFVWNFMDIFIMMVGKGIAYRFEQIKMRINKLLDKIPEAVFMDIRDHYIKLIELLEYVDEDLSGIILLSCANNLYFVCYQLLNIFNKLRWPINYVYFWFSLLFLIGRTAFVFLTAASINDEAKDALNVLRRVPATTWCVEVERLIFQMTTSTVALSGKKFYFLTRRLLFGMAGTIVTYELVLLQFDEPNRSKGLPDLCT